MSSIIRRYRIPFHLQKDKDDSKRIELKILRYQTYTLSLLSILFLTAKYMSIFYKI